MKRTIGIAALLAAAASLSACGTKHDPNMPTDEENQPTSLHSQRERLEAFCASQDCAFTTGAVFDISGGRATY